MKSKTRCGWVTQDQIYIDYHDKEWGVPIFDDQKLFEFLILEGAQAGLSWITVLKKREEYRKSFDQFDPQKIVRYKETKIQKLLLNPGIIRNKLKVNAAVINAKAFHETVKEFGSFSHFIWQFVDGTPQKNHWKSLKEVPSRSDASDKMSKELKKRGFKFIGTTICYAFMQATGMVNDHTIDCFRHREINKK